MLIETEKQGEQLTIKIVGDIDHHTAAMMRMETDDSIFQYRPKEVILDLSNVNFMDSAGLGFILGRQRCAKMNGARFHVYHPTKRIVMLLEMAGTDKLLDIIYENQLKKVE